MLDEPSMGLAPILVEQIFDIIQELNQHGTTILLVEQNAQMALSVAHRGYVLETGQDRHHRHRRGAAGGRGSEKSLSGRLTVPSSLSVRGKRGRNFLCRALSHKITHQNATSCP